MTSRCRLYPIPFILVRVYTLMNTFKFKKFFDRRPDMFPRYAKRLFYYGSHVQFSGLVKAFDSHFRRLSMLPSLFGVLAIVVSPLALPFTFLV